MRDWQPKRRAKVNNKKNTCAAVVYARESTNRYASEYRVAENKI